MLTIQKIDVPGYETVIEATQPEVGLHCFIAVHNTTLGPALGGTRIYPYSNRQDALQDALRLAKAMTYKSAIAQDGLGGGKSVLIADPKRHKTPELFKAFAQVLNTLKGNYICAEDVGTTPDDMAAIRKHSPYVAALPATMTSSGDPSRFTVWGIYRGIQATCQWLWGTTSVKGRKIAIQGLGSVGSKLSNLLFWEGADLIVCDIDERQARYIAYLDGAQLIDTSQYPSTPCDILAPCALGGIINTHTIPLLRCQAIAGSANNQLADPRCARMLLERGILYAPDYIINAGGIINAAAEFDPGGYNPKRALEKTNKIYETLLSVYEQSQKENCSTLEVADRMAEYNLKQGIGKREQPVRFPG
jgi:leucine dehydrogenase